MSNGTAAGARNSTGLVRAATAGDVFAVPAMTVVGGVATVMAPVAGAIVQRPFIFQLTLRSTA
jgi:hypothetical protein